MADNVYSMKKNLKNQKNAKDTEEQVGTFVEKNHKPIIIISILICVAVIGVCIAYAVIENTNKSNIAKIDAIEYALTKNGSGLTDEEIATRQTAALDAIAPYLKKSGIAGVRANMLAADVSMQKKDYKNSCTYWIAAAEDGKKSYTAPICYYNAAVCSEELNDNQAAETYYTKASEAKDFLLITHTLFSLGRVQETSGDVKKAAATYKKMIDTYPNDGWTKLAQSRLISLEANGKVTAEELEPPAKDDKKTK